jgi:hypothetical protein
MASITVLDVQVTQLAPMPTVTYVAAQETSASVDDDVVFVSSGQ